MPITKPRRRLLQLLVKISSFISKEKHDAERTWRVARNWQITNRLFLDLHWAGGLDRYSMHDSRHVLSGSKAGIWRRLSVKLSADGPRQNFNSHSPFWHSAQCAVLHRRAWEDEFYLDHAAFEPDGGGGLPLEFNIACSSGNCPSPNTTCF